MQSVERSGLRYRRLFEVAQDGIVIFGAIGRIALVNNFIRAHKFTKRGVSRKAIQLIAA